MPLAPLAQLSDVVALLGHTVTVEQQGYITTLIATASGKVRAYTGQDFTAATADTIVLNGNSSTRITLPQRPVTSVTSVAIRGTTLSPSSYAWDRLGNIDLISGVAAWNDFDNIFGQSNALAVGASSPAGGLLSGPAGSIFPDVQAGPSWGGGSAAITVMYNHGYADIPGVVVDEVAGMVAAQMAVPVGVKDEQIGGYKVGFIRAPGGAMTLTEDARRNLNKYRRTAFTTSAAVPR